MVRPLTLLLPLLALQLTGCGDWAKAQACADAGTCNAGAAGGGNAIDGPINKLTEDELGQLCDQFASRVGGYGGKTCPDGNKVLTTIGSSEQCVASSQFNNGACTATVAAWQACASLLENADPCTAGKVGAAQSSPACTAYYGSGSCVSIN